MNHLAKEWLTNGLIDFEYKKYIMMSYMQYVQSRFSDKMLYPIFTDLKNHYEYLRDFKSKKKFIDDSFPKKMSRIDIKRQKIIYKRMIQNEEHFSQLDEITEYGLELFDEKIKIGKQLIELIKASITIVPIGVLPLYKNEGYLIISTEQSKTLWIYKYNVGPLKLFDDNEQIKTSLMSLKRKSIGNTFERIKIELTKTYKQMPNPATYLIHCDEDFPFHQTYLPVAKKLFEDKLAA